MAKTKAQIMKDYRERKKASLGDKWLKSESQRVKSYFVPVAQLNREKKIKRRDKERTRKQRYRLKKKLMCENEQQRTEDAPSISTETIQEDSFGVSSTTGLKVKLSFPSKKKKSKTKSNTYRKMKYLEERCKLLSKKYETTKRQLSRVRSAAKSKLLTPRSKVDSLLKKSNIRPESVPEVRKRLLFSECLAEEVKDASTKNKKETIMRVISGKIVKKYRMNFMLSKMTGIDRRHARSTKKNIEIKKKPRLDALRRQIQSDIHTFMLREDNSRVLPGKKDSVTVNKEKHQKHVLNDYLHNLHVKFCAENNYSVSLATFCRNRPQYVALVNFASRNVCLCSKHQNFSLKLRCLKNLGVCSCTSPDKFVEDFDDDAINGMLEHVSTENIRYQEWKRVKMSDGKERIRIVDQEENKQDFIKVMKESVDKFREHVKRVKDQYRALRQMKEKLPEKHLILQMDFSENYTCQAMEEIQSAYWNSSMVTLHPCVSYYKTDGKLIHKSTVFVSHILHHNATMVYAIVNKMMENIKQNVPDTEYVHFWTDSPTSQYRNKYIFNLICQFQERFNMKASWQYFESGHGKSACDGIGGITKRNADNEVKRGKSIIQDANDFFAWAVQSDSEISYEFITEENFKSSKEDIDRVSENLKPVKGTMDIHAVVGVSDHVLASRTTTCVCESCFADNGFEVRSSSCLWNEHDIQKASVNNVPQNTQANGTQIETPTSTPSDTQVTVDEKVSPNLFVLAVYDKEVYVGKVLEVDYEDNTVNITCMEKSGKLGKTFKWPSPKSDEIWVNRSDILKVIAEPIPTGKTRRLFNLSEEANRFITQYTKS